ncbi:MAG: hypothetical protein K9I71_08625 [Ignavibacteriales bacterium]|nr:hypothetical protein [Ignavibacteriales bacterium]MCF8316176.1 hypothetical protein [Ignavibacteriales bacterium]MCF8436678.1 hypothetical protein [Ignavibacteriales bacterium]
MAKTIKFNLMLDGKPVRTIEELQENFCIDDILEFYQKRLLQKWLKVRGFDEYLKKVDAISEKKSAIVELIKIFELEKSEKEIKEAVYSLEFWQERKIELEEWNKKDHKIKDIIADYHKGYNVLKTKILENKEDMPFMKSAAKEIFDKYYEIFKIDFSYFFDEMKNSAPLILFAMMMQNKYRESRLFTDIYKKQLFNLIPQSIKEVKIQKHQEDTNHNWKKITNKTVIIKKIDNPSKQVKLKNQGKEYSSVEAINKIFESGFEFYSYASGDFVEYAEISVNKIPEIYKTFSGDTDKYWKDLEPKGRKFLILKIEPNNFIRNAGKSGEELNAEKINENFIILDGIDYKSNSNSDLLIYMEV